MSAAQLHRLRNLLAIIIGGVETDNKEAVKLAVRSMDRELSRCDVSATPMFDAVDGRVQL